MAMTATLRSQADFARNPMCYRVPDDSASSHDIVGALLGAHCAGMSQRASVADVRAALSAEPKEDCLANQIINWLRGSLAIHEVTTLISRARIPLGRIADHVR